MAAILAVLPEIMIAATGLLFAGKEFHQEVKGSGKKQGGKKK